MWTKFGWRDICVKAFGKLNYWESFVDMHFEKRNIFFSFLVGWWNGAAREIVGADLYQQVLRVFDVLIFFFKSLDLRNLNPLIFGNAWFVHVWHIVREVSCVSSCAERFLAGFQNSTTQCNARKELRVGVIKVCVWLLHIHSNFNDFIFYLWEKSVLKIEHQIYPFHYFSFQLEMTTRRNTCSI